MMSTISKYNVVGWRDLLELEIREGKQQRPLQLYGGQFLLNQDHPLLSEETLHNVGALKSIFLLEEQIFHILRN